MSRGEKWVTRFVYVLLWVLVMYVTGKLVYAAEEVKAPPPLPDQPVAEQKYLQELYRHIANCPNITASPATRNGKKGDCVLAVYGGNTKLCLNTGSGPGLSTTWLCSPALAAP